MARRRHVPGLYGYVGIPRSGKSFTERVDAIAAARAGHSTLWFDPNEETHTLPSDLSVSGHFVTEAALAKLRAAPPGHVAVVRVPLTPANFDAAAEWAMESSGSIVMPEAHNGAPNALRTLPPNASRLTTAFRHRGASLFWDSQRLALINVTLRENTAENLHVFATTGLADRQVLRDMGGYELEAAALEAARRMQAGQPGWHVKLGLVRLPPYTLERR